MKTLILFTALCLLIVSSSSMEYNITTILSKYPNFTTMKGVLSDTGLAEEINRRDTITLLVMSDTSITEFVRVKNLDMELVKKILCVHVILDYYDVEKLTKLGILDKPSTLTTLYQASGSAVGSEGFINVSLIGEGEIAFGSAVPGSLLSSKLVNTVEQHPFSLSILQITSPIWVEGIGKDPPVFPPTLPPPAVPVPGSAPGPEESSHTPRRRPKAHAPVPAADGTTAAANGTVPPPKKNAGSVAAEVGVVVAAVVVLLASLLVAN